MQFAVKSVFEFCGLGNTGKCSSKALVGRGDACALLLNNGIICFSIQFQFVPADFTANNCIEWTDGQAIMSKNISYHDHSLIALTTFFFYYLAIQ